MRTFARSLTLVAVLLSTSALAEVKTLWTVDLPAKAKWQTTTDRGLLLLGADSGLFAVDPNTGKVLWTRTDLQKVLPFAIKEEPTKSLLLVTDIQGFGGSKTTLAAVDQTTGLNVWSVTLSGQNLGAYPDPERWQVILFAADYTKGAGVFARAYDVATGVVKWEAPYAKSISKIPMYMADNSGIFSAYMDYSGHQEPVIANGVMYVPFKGMDALDLATGTFKWGSDFKTGHKTYKKAYPRPVVQNGVVYAGGLGMLYAFDAATGATKWQAPIKSGLLTEIVTKDALVLTRLGGQFYDPGKKQNVLDKPTGIAAFDMATGAEKWVYTGMVDGITNMVVVGNRVVVADSRSLLGVDLSTGAEAFSTKLQFKAKASAAEHAALGLSVLGGFLNGGLSGAASGVSGSMKAAEARQDIPQTVQVLDDGSLFVRGGFNAVSFDAAKSSQKWSTQITPPGDSGLGLAALGATVAFTQVGYAGMSANSGTSYARSAGADTASLAKSAAKRYVAAKSGQNNAYFLGKLDAGGVGVVVLDAKSGVKKAEVPLGDKTPVYATDEAASRIYYATDKGKLIAYGF
jgi:outer membrane protein assembly factor BamB